MKLKYKVLNTDLTSPFQNFKYELNKEYICLDFDESDEECSTGFYATDLEGILYSYKKGRKVFIAEMDGKEKYFDVYKHRFEKQTIIREIKIRELKKLLKEESKKVGYNLLEACFPINPLSIKRSKDITEKEVKLLKRWSSFCSSVGSSVYSSVWLSVGSSVYSSVGLLGESSVYSSVGLSFESLVESSVYSSVGLLVESLVESSVFAYISSLFPNIKKWKYIDHEEGINPFQSCIDLWKAGLVPSYDGKTWRLHAGEKADVVCEMII